MDAKFAYNSNVLLFDADCILCNKSVQYIIKHDSKNIFQFASLQSHYGQQFLKEHNLSTNLYSTVIYVQNDKIFTKSTAAIRAFSKLNNWRKHLIILLLIPRPIRDYVYAIIAKNRKHFFKGQTTCLIPSDELKAKML
jgi:predicted DCC family thiol-disulfide oxidoreductase YuxK